MTVSSCGPCLTDRPDQAPPRKSATSHAVRSPMQDGTTVALREVILHMVEEYARHLGHADLLRERIDGRVGQ